MQCTQNSGSCSSGRHPEPMSSPLIWGFAKPSNQLLPVWSRLLTPAALWPHWIWAHSCAFEFGTTSDALDLSQAEIKEGLQSQTPPYKWKDSLRAILGAGWNTWCRVRLCLESTKIDDSNITLKYVWARSTGKHDMRSIARVFKILILQSSYHAWSTKGERPWAI